MDNYRRSITVLRGNDFNLIWGFSDAQGNPLNLDGIDYKLAIRSSVNGSYPLSVSSIDGGVIRADIDCTKLPVGTYYFDFSWSKSTGGVKTSYRSKTDEIVIITEDIDSVSEYSTVNVDSVIVSVGSSQGLKDVYVITSEDETEPSDSNVFSAKRALKDFLRKNKEDIASEIITFLKGIIFGENNGSIDGDGIARLRSILLESGLFVGDFESGMLGKGLCAKIDENGDSYIEADRLFIRKIATFVQLLIQEIKHVGGQIILTPASMKCTRVEEHDTYYRCFFEKTDGDRIIENQFVVGDQARRQTFNVKAGMNEGVSNEYYFRLVTGVGEDFIDLSRTDCDPGSTIPMAGDDIVQLGNRNDPTRQTAIILSAYGEDAPFFKMYKKIKSYSLSEAEKIVNISSKEVYFCADVFKFTSGKNVEEEVVNLSDSVDGLVNDLVLANEAIKDIQNQLDGVVEIWFYDPVPTLDNEPAVNWTTDSEKDKHLGDMYYDANGSGYRFEKRNGVYQWAIITDSAALEALEAAKKAQDTADGKRRIFVEQPKASDAYDEGDMWANATYGDLYSNDLLRCNTAKAVNSPFSIDHWELASKYTDDTKANQAIEDAANAQAAADKAQEDADAANSELGMIASDSYITPSEKTALKQQQADIQAERNEIIANATRYGVSYSAYNAAYTLANNALTKYTASNPQNIEVGADYANISAYYAARKTILDAIAAAAKKLVTDLDNDLQGYKSEVTQKFEAVDGRFTSVINETKTYTDNAVGNIQVGGRNLLWKTNQGVLGWFKTVYNGSTNLYAEEIRNVNSVKIAVTEISTSYHAINFSIGDAIKNLKRNGVYTLSFDILSNVDTTLSVRMINANGTNLITTFGSKVINKDEWIHVDFTATLGGEDSYYTNSQTIYLLGLNKVGTYYIQNLKLEQGNKATDWTPAPEDLTTKIEENSSKIEQLPDQISLTVKKEITGGGFNYITNTQSSVEVVGDNQQYQTVENDWILKKEIAGKKFGCAFKIKFEGCTFGASASFILRTDVGGGWNNTILTPQKSISSNGEYFVYTNNNTAVNATQDISVKVRLSYVSGGKITISEIRAYDVPEGLTDALPWYPSKWDTEVLSSEIKQTAESISLKVNQVVGGTNLLSNTSFSADLNGWSLLNSSTGMTAKIVSKGGYQCLELWTDGARRGLYAYLDNRSLVKAGDKFTISFDLYRTSSAVSTLAIGLEDGGADFIKKTLSGNLNTWVRLTYTQTMDTNNPAFIIYGAGNAGTVYIKNIKVEMGTIATAWTPSPLEQNNKLLATGIDIYNKRIDITADKLRIKNNSGTPIAVFDGSGSTPKLKSENIDVENLKVKHLDGADGTFSGILSAVTGNIGDLEISGGYLLSNGGGKKGIAFTSNYMSNYFENISSQKTITMDPGDGYGAKPYTFTLLGNRKTEVRKSNTSVNHIYVADMMNIQYTGFLKDSRYGFQYAMLGSGHCILDGVVDGGCWGHIAFEENNTFEQINPHLIGNRIIITPSYSNNYVIFPTLVKMHMFLGQDIAQRVSVQFTYVITIINQSTNAVAIMGRANTTIGSLNLNNSQFPKFYNQSGTLMDQPREYTIKPFCARQFMLAYDGGEFYAFEL